MLFKHASAVLLPPSSLLSSPFFLRPGVLLQCPPGEALQEQFGQNSKAEIAAKDLRAELEINERKAEPETGI
eukprot:gene20554-27345_t